MSQDNVYGYLKSHKGFHKSRTIGKALGINSNTICISLKKLMERGDIERKLLDGRYNHYGYAINQEAAKGMLIQGQDGCKAKTEPVKLPRKSLNKEQMEDFRYRIKKYQERGKIK